MNKNYIPLYRKYRPQKLEEIVGQEHVKRALANAIETNRIAHAYLFTGPRGTGKTSCARIFAKSLNCEHGPTISPCNECENCNNITKSIPIDVIEIDAASNRSVNDAEEIIQNVAMAPVHSRYKIYIIDEVHMLTSTAFNALLKTLEEPPENVIFILATTEVHKVLDTIKSRCQRFDFKRITTKDISCHLRYISDSENINITDDALSYIAQNSAGGMRDSIALLDQLSVLNNKDTKIDVDDINRLLGRLSFDCLTSLFNSIAVSNQEQALEVLNSIYNQGNEPIQILSNFLDYLRNLLIVKSVGGQCQTSTLQLNEEQIKVSISIVEKIEKHQLVSLINKCAQYIKELKQTSNTKLWLDISILDMSNLVENTKLDDLLKRISALEAGSVVPVRPAINAKPVLNNISLPNNVEKTEISVSAKVSEPDDNSSKIQAQSNVAANSSKISQNTGGNIKQLWELFLNNISSSASSAILKQQAMPVKISEDEVIITIKNQAWLNKFSSDGERFAFLQEASKKIFGVEPKIIVRAPQAGDDKLRSENSNNTLQITQNPKQSLIKQAPKEDVENIEQLQEDLSAVKTQQIMINDKTEQDKNNSNNNKITYSIRPQDAAYHSDNVNMVMDLFEGKIIE